MMMDYLAVWRARAARGNPEMHDNKRSGFISKERGAIAPGLFADIIAMPADPLQDVESLRKVNFVMKNGKIVRNSK